MRQNRYGAKSAWKRSLIVRGFAPMQNPKIAICVVVENAGFGATWAAPIASLIMEKYFNDTISTASAAKA